MERLKHPDHVIPYDRFVVTHADTHPLWASDPGRATNDILKWSHPLLTVLRNPRNRIVVRSLTTMPDALALEARLAQHMEK